MAVVKQVLVAEVLRNRERLGVVQYFEATDAQLVAGARSSAAGVPVTTTDDSRSALHAASKSPAATFAFETVHCRMPVPSRTTTNASLPEERVR